MLSDIEISQQNQPEPIGRIAEKAGLCEEDLELYGRYKAKIGFAKLHELAAKPLKGKLILVTAITPTPAGEGKSTISIGLADALQLSRKKSHAGAARAFARPLLRTERRRDRRRLFADCADGRH